MTSGIATGRALRPTAKVLPEHARGHNRSLVLQTLYSALGADSASALSRADVARETGLTRVTVSDLVAELIDEGLVIETGPREDSRPGKPATVIAVDRTAVQIVGIDLSDHATFRGALLALDGEIIQRAELPLAGPGGATATGEDALRILDALVAELVVAATRPIIGIGVGSPGVVDADGVVLSAPNLGWHGEPLRARLEARFDLPVVVANDANVAVLAEHGLGGGDADMLLVTIGHGVGAGLVVGGMAIVGSRSAAGEIGHVVVGTDGGPDCACGRQGCLEAWLAVPRLRAALETATDAAARDQVLTAAGQRLGIALAPVVGALDLAEVVLTGPEDLIDGPLITATAETLGARTLAEFHGHVQLRRSELGRDIVTRGAAVMVISSRLGVS
jgi:predicted NBD/HSP70 family sugar kinase